MPTTNAFDWRALIPQAVALGSKAIGDRVAPGPDIQNVQLRQKQLDEEKRQFDIQQGLTQQKLAQSNQIRSSLMPGMYTALGYNPGAARKMAADYSAVANRPVALGSMPGNGMNTTYTPGASNANPTQTGGGPGVGRTIANVGLGMAPAVVGALAKGGGAAAGGAGGLGAALGAAAPFAAVGGAALAAGLLWKRSQAHPVADTWVQHEQNPFDGSMANIDRAIQGGQMSPEEGQRTKMQNAQNYLNELTQFARRGGREREVANNALRTFRQYYGDPAQYGFQIGGF